MRRKGIYQRYIPSVSPDENNSAPSYWFVFTENKMMVCEDHEKTYLPQADKLEDLHISPVRTQYLGTLDGYPCYSAEINPGTVAPEGMVFRDLRSLYMKLDEDIFLLAGKAIQVVNWDSNHQFCGRCGTPTRTLDDEMAKICPECGFISHTRLSPAVITAIVKDGKLLMAKHSRASGDMYGLIAGFVEAGETLEEAVKRETWEEVGLKVKNIRYFGSQPWPFPNSLMLGFTADYESGNIQADGNEIIDAHWFRADELPRQPSKMSIARELIDWYLRNYQSI
ncbi:NAD(+) diphosphatase [Methanobacterium petrolearium]|uniref:NAD(+) diphosphatase n=1 Tax=Methanobacterium petrolearium TaxID=710190 RepID=UPI001AE9ECA5|nr:NAD(+) diphosphatase [Methanobacterium petrolearium]MBP1946277.1 NAD+ diphosphatase [Methanobacterium petrolearium]BDZ71371.1 NADH pyrophosphatase [Methanobacterium petrolearium]